MEMLKGTIRSFDNSSYKAAVQVSGSLATWLDGIPVARNIPTEEVTPGRSCAVVFFDPGNPTDAVIVAVYA